MKKSTENTIQLIIVFEQLWTNQPFIQLSVVNNTEHQQVTNKFDTNPQSSQIIIMSLCHSFIFDRIVSELGRREPWTKAKYTLDSLFTAGLT